MRRRDDVAAAPRPGVLCAPHMDNAFPHSLFPGFYNSGPSSGADAEAATVLQAFGDWGSHEQIQPLHPPAGERQQQQQAGERKWVALRSLARESWDPLEPVAVPLLPPNAVCKFQPASLEDLSYVGNVMKSRENNELAMRALNFPEQMAYFFIEHRDDAFRSMGKLLEESFYFGDCILRGRARDKTISVNFLTTFTERVKQRQCPISNNTPRARLSSHLFGESMFDIPPTLLAENVHEEMNFQRNQLLFNHSATGGALVYWPFSEGSSCEEGCLMYPSTDLMSSLNFRKIKLDFDDDEVPKLNAKFNKPASVSLNGRINQIACSEVDQEVFVGVRSDYCCGAWKLSKSMKPSPLQVVQVENVATCVNVSPHLPGELVIASECGTAYLWNVDKGLQRIRKETENLNFNAQLPWRWCDFTAHPRVYLYADRTGLDLTDVRAGESCNQTLFKMGATASCQRGERVILPKHLQDVHPFHYLITTQYSAYIIDERFPIVPVLKWRHMMGSPPMFAQVVSGASRNETHKIVLGTQRTQEALLLQYSGGTRLPCQSFGPPQKLSSNYDMLKQLPVKLFLRQEAVITERLHSPGAGIAAFYHRRGRNSLSVIQLSAAGDLFYQTLVPRKNGCDDGNPTKERVGNDSEPISPTLNNGVLSEDPSGHGDPEEVGGGEGKRSEGASPPLRADKEGTPTLSSQSTRKPPLSRAALVTCRRWLKSFVNKQKELNTNSKVLPKHCFINVKHKFSCKNSDESGDAYKEVRDRIKSVMEKREILSHSTFPILDPVSVPDPVDPSVWKDDLSDRLTAAWEEKWSEWWSEKLGMNHDKRIKVLQAKRKNEKSARARHRRGLSGSFTSSVSEFSDFTDASIWSRTSTENLKESDYLSDTESHTLLNRSTTVSRANGSIVLEQEEEVQTSAPEAEGSQKSVLDPGPSLEIQLRSMPRERKGILQKYMDALEDNPPQPEQDDEMSYFLPIATSSQIPLMSTPHVNTNCEAFAASPCPLAASPCPLAASPCPLAASPCPLRNTH
eukprot:gi/632959020/ref/XP_007895379.1/ PREDICTED: TATA box-binding protein-associated factor RNA polymerase I subunit C [Callorhinchus milii]